MSAKCRQKFERSSRGIYWQVGRVHADSGIAPRHGKRESVTRVRLILPQVIFTERRLRPSIPLLSLSSTFKFFRLPPRLFYTSYEKSAACNRQIFLFLLLILFCIITC